MLVRPNKISAKAICSKQWLEANQLDELGTAEGKEGSKRQSQTSKAKTEMNKITKQDEQGQKEISQGRLRPGPESIPARKGGKIQAWAE